MKAFLWKLDRKFEEMIPEMSEEEAEKPPTPPRKPVDLKNSQLMKAFLWKLDRKFEEMIPEMSEEEAEKPPTPKQLDLKNSQLMKAFLWKLDRKFEEMIPEMSEEEAEKPPTPKPIDLKNSQLMKAFLWKLEQKFEEMIPIVSTGSISKRMKSPIIFEDEGSGHEESSEGIIDHMPFNYIDPIPKDRSTERLQNTAQKNLIPLTASMTSGSKERTIIQYSDRSESSCDEIAMGDTPSNYNFANGRLDGKSGGLKSILQE